MYRIFSFFLYRKFCQIYEKFRLNIIEKYIKIQIYNITLCIVCIFAKKELK